MIFLNEPLEDRDQVINFIVDQAKNNGFIKEKDEFLQALLEREKVSSTAFEFKIAIPHGKADTVVEPFVSFLSTEEPFVWDKQGEEKETQYVFLIGVPEKGGSKIHLKYISEVSKKLLDENFRDRLFNSSELDEAYEVLSAININQ